MSRSRRLPGARRVHGQSETLTLRISPVQLTGAVVVGSKPAAEPIFHPSAADSADRVRCRRDRGGWVVPDRAVYKPVSACFGGQCAGRQE